MEEDNTRPNLIDPIFRKEIHQQIDQQNISQGRYIREFIKSVYYSYIRPNFGVIICILVIFCLIYLRYIMIKGDPVKEEPKKIVQEIHEEPSTPPTPPIHYPELTDGYGHMMTEDMFTKTVPFVNQYPVHINEPIPDETNNSNIYYY